MEEEVLVIHSSDGLQLEAILRHPKETHSDVAIVMAHPHPLYGGDMQNNVLRIVAKHLSKHGIPSLRFNFRGVGHSEGNYSNGIGEMLDLSAAIAKIETKLPKHKVLLYGYSFGSSVCWNLITTQSNNKYPAILVSPPVEMLHFEKKSPESNVLMISGSKDEFTKPATIERFIEELPTPAQERISFKVIDSDHFWMGKEKQLAQETIEFIKSLSPTHPTSRTTNEAE